MHRCGRRRRWAWGGRRHSRAPHTAPSGPHAGLRRTPFRVSALLRSGSADAGQPPRRSAGIDVGLPGTVATPPAAPRRRCWGRAQRGGTRRGRKRDIDGVCGRFESLVAWLHGLRDRRRRRERGGRACGRLADGVALERERVGHRRARKDCGPRSSLHAVAGEGRSGGGRAAERGACDATHRPVSRQACVVSTGSSSSTRSGAIPLLLRSLAARRCCRSVSASLSPAARLCGAWTGTAACRSADRCCARGHCGGLAQRRWGCTRRSSSRCCSCSCARLSTRVCEVALRIAAATAATVAVHVCVPRAERHSSSSCSTVERTGKRHVLRSGSSTCAPHRRAQRDRSLVGHRGEDADALVSASG